MTIQETRRRAFALLLLGLSVVLTISVAEVAVRSIYRFDYEVIPYTWITDLGTERSQRRAAHEMRTYGRLSYSFDAELGWDAHGGFIRAAGTGSDWRGADEPPRPLLVTIGDSFTYGSDVPPHASYPALLAHKLGAGLVNLGVPGYDIGQPVLKLERHLPEFVVGPSRKTHGLIVVWGIFEGNYRRTTVPYYLGPKPAYELGPRGEIVVRNEHLEPREEYEATLAKAFPPLMLWSPRFVAAHSKALWLDRFTPAHQRFLDHWDLIISSLIDRVRRLLPSGTNLLVVAIPDPDNLATPSRAHGLTDRSSYYRRIVDILRASRADYVDLLEEYRKGPGIEPVSRGFFTNAPPPRQRGHLNAEGNDFLASLLARRIRAASASPLAGNDHTTHERVK